MASPHNAPPPPGSFAIPHPKRFSAVNINKKFLQKNAPAPPAPVPAPAPRPAPQPAPPHSRLVTAKLTSAAQLAPPAGQGWSRPSSATPPVSTTPAAPPPAPAPAPAPTPASAPPRPRDPAPKPVWGNPNALAPPDTAPHTDFPTAAEVAQGQSPRPAPTPAHPPTARLKPDDAPPQPRPPPQEADAFRGVHLDPNAHHWDEMEEDDDNFLDNVIEFEDGRQYKVAPSVVPPSHDDPEPLVVAPDHVSAEPVSKEDRFADDFDRSWPRTSQSPALLHHDLPARVSRHPSLSPASSHPSLDASRVLFNERSNKLEPYTTSHFSNRLAPTLRRNPHGDPLPPDPRLSRDPAPHSPVHLLQKPSDAHQPSKAYDFLPRRNDGGPPAFPSDYSQSRPRSRDASGSSASFHDSRVMSEKRLRRLSGASLASSAPDGPQQPDVPFSRRPQTSKSPLQQLSVLAENVASPSSGLTDGTRPECPSLDIEGVHKTAMHLSAERAKQRRQLEEEEREKEKERARKKAAELEARMLQAQASSFSTTCHPSTHSAYHKAVSTETTQQAASPARDSNQLVTDSKEHEPLEAVRNDLPKLVTRPLRDIKPSRSTSSVNDPVPPSEQVDSWRSKTRPPSQPLPTLSSPMFQEPSVVAADENLEVVDFSDLGKFVGSQQVALPSVTPAPSSYSPASSDRHSFSVRPVASDFFEDDSPRAPITKVTASPSADRRSLSTVPEVSALASSDLSSPGPLREYDSHRFSGPNGNSLPRSHPSPTAPHHRLSKGPAPFRQVTMSALDDVMSRIKGALDDMQVDAGKAVSSNETVDWRTGVPKPKVRVLEPPIPTRTLSKEPKWLPPALRQSRPELDQEIFGATGCEPPFSPRPVALVVKLPAVLRPIEALPKRQLQLLRKPAGHIRYDILSWDPPVDGMNKRDLSINDILFRRPPLKGAKPRYRVQLPRSIRASLPKVNLPSGFPKNNAVSGRSKTVDDLPTWRRTTPPSTSQKPPSAEETPPDLNVMSCSSPPESAALALEPTALDVTAKSESYLVRQRTLPRLPQGSAVGFYRDPSSSCQDSKGVVNFTVTSELEEVQASEPESSILLSSSIIEVSPAATLPESKESTATASPIVDEAGADLQLPALTLSIQGDGKVSEESTERSLRTPASASFNTPWTKSPLSFSSKDSPARAPDPEHLRAVWSQATDKEPISAVNSLEGIADDLTALPFTIQEVKSEDGETPPPTSATVASKISLHDVTRAFQQVPTPSNAPSHRPSPMSPPATNGSITRPPSFNYPTPLQAPNAVMRPHFAAFPSPMLAHSPSPTVMYPPPAPSPIPRVAMNGHPPMYNQPMWVPMQPSQNNGAVRPVPSPYPTQMVAYPAPAQVHSVYAPGLSPQNVPPSVTGSAPPRPRGVPMLSPVMHPAAPANVPMYNGSPVLMHPPAMMPSGHRPPYMNSVPSERGQGRTDMSATPHMQQPPPSQGHIPPQPVYTHVPFSRPSW